MRVNGQRTYLDGMCHFFRTLEPRPQTQQAFRPPWLTSPVRRSFIPFSIMKEDTHGSIDPCSFQKAKEICVFKVTTQVQEFKDGT